MRTVRTFVVVPTLPERLQGLKKIAHNLWWGWDHDAIDLFRRLDRQLWEECGHNPVKMLGQITQERLSAAAESAGFLAHLDRVLEKLDSYLTGRCWFDGQKPPEQKPSIAYFSAEFGLTECMPIYSGGLGVLAGDHLKSASDLGLPLVGVGLLYRQGYFQQYLNADGWQQESFPENDFYNMPITLMIWEDGRPIRFHVDIGGHDVVAQIWQVTVGRVALYLLDTNLRCNRLEDRQITSQLYGGDSNMRLRQEILLGIGGFTALKTLNMDPMVCHINEGHAAFMALERIRRMIEEKQINFAQAKEATSCSNIFTTHTPVPAGHDVFSPSMMEKYFSNYVNKLGLDWKGFMALGRVNPENRDESFSMTNLALRLSAHHNGVSKLHGSISRLICKDIWPGVPAEEIPIDSVTNGIHIRSWISHEMSELYDRYLGPGWSEPVSSEESFSRIEQIPDEELWRTHERRRERLVAFSRRRLVEQLRRRGASALDIAHAEEALDPEALTIGFARRFATYKRGALLFRDLERFKKILSDKDRPVQIIFAGKAHPKDAEGKELIRTIVHFVREEAFRRRVVFLENYDINVARYLVQGVDVWLNTPKRGMEASGTSGMKGLANGVLNMSILDGWWCEGYRPDCGWAIGHGESYEDRDYQDEVESHAIYDLLEKEVIPCFFSRGSDRLPRRWIGMMKNSIRYLSRPFSTSRMVAEYAQRFYLPSAQRYEMFTSDNLAHAKELADWKDGIRDNWSQVAVGKVDVINKGELSVGNDLQVRCQIKLGRIDPNDVKVELYEGPVDSQGNVQNGQAVLMECVGSAHNDYYIFNGNIPCSYSGLCGFSVRVIPYHSDMANKYDMALVRWEDTVSESEPVEATVLTDS